MPLKGYGVWRCTATEWDPRQKPDHGHLAFTDDSGGTYDAAVNVMSKSADTRLVYWLVRDFDKEHPLTTMLMDLSSGFHAVHGPNGLALDLLRGNLVDIRAGVILSHDGSNNDIIEYLTPIINQAIDAQADVFLYGQQYFPGKDGTHDIHMNQGSTGSFTRDNGVWQDGGIIMAFPDGHWEAIFLAFASQASVTDSHGQPNGPLFSDLLSVDTQPGGEVGAAEPDTDAGETRPGLAALSIQAALINPVGPDQQPTTGPGETVFLLNRSTKSVSLAGWSISNGTGQQQKLGKDATVAALSKEGFLVPGCPLSNNGGEIMLKNPEGEVVRKVGYSKAQAKREGKPVYFHDAGLGRHRH